MAGVHGPCCMCGGGICSHHRYRVIDDGKAHLKCLPSPCPKCGENREYVSEAMVSGFCGYVCINTDCPRDQ